jgi:hypothetical protein
MILPCTSRRTLQVLHSIRSTAALPYPSQPLTARLCPCVPRGEDFTRYSRLRGSLHQREQQAQSIVKLLAFRCAEGLALLYSVLMNCVARVFYSFRKSSEIKFENGSVVQLLPRRIGRSSLPWMQGKCDGIPRCCASAIITLARSCMSISEPSTRDCGSPFHELIALRLTFVSIRPCILLRTPRSIVSVLIAGQIGFRREAASTRGAVACSLHVR